MHYYPPFMMPFQERRRLSQCKEEEDEDESDNNCRHGRAGSTSGQRITGTRHKFIVTKTLLAAAMEPAVTAVPESATPAAPRIEAEPLRHMTAKQNAATIHFPCSSATSGQSSVMREAFFTPQRQFSPHMDKRFFDTSLVEIRGSSAKTTATAPTAETTETEVDRSSTRSLNVWRASDVVDGNVWVPRTSSAGTDVTSVSGRLEGIHEILMRFEVFCRLLCFWSLVKTTRTLL